MDEDCYIFILSGWNDAMIFFLLLQKHESLLECNKENYLLYSSNHLAKMSYVYTIVRQCCMILIQPPVGFPTDFVCQKQ